MSERRARRVPGQHESVQRQAVLLRDDEDALTRAIIQLASQHGGYGYRRVTALLRHAGWRVNRKRVERIWRQQGLRVPAPSSPTAVFAADRMHLKHER